MELTYTEIHDLDGNLIGVQRSDGWSIPADPANSDYQAYLNPDKVEHLTEIPPQAALSTPMVTEK
jgi:hypothetical protein